MNKVFAGVVMGLALGAVSAVSAIDMSVGGGGFFASDFGAGFTGMKSTFLGIEAKQSAPWVGGGLNVFFDLTYAEIDLGLTFAGGDLKYTLAGVDMTALMGDKPSFSGTALNIGALGKYPIALGESMSLFPAVGIDYSLVLSATSKVGGTEEKIDGSPEGEAKAGDFSALWIKFGAGLDYNLTEKLFIRPTILYGIRLGNSNEDKEVKDAKDADPTGTYESLLGHGLTVKVNVGFRL